MAFHQSKKMGTDEWMGYVERGKLRAALVAINPQKPNGPWTVLCDGEKFLHSRRAVDACRRQKVRLLKVPPRSPDLNPVEKFWSWLRRELIALA